MSLPTLVDYQEPLVMLPEETQNYNVCMTAVNGSTFTPSSQILVDLGNRGFLDPASLIMRYTITYTGTATTTALITGTPAYQPFLRLDTLVNSQTVETINNYNTVANMWTNLSLSISDKLGQQFNLGYVGDSAGDLDNENTDGAGIVFGTGITSVSDSYSAPIIGLLGNCEKLIPLFLLNNTRLAFTLETVANITSSIAANSKVSNFSISNFEICYNMIDFGQAVQQEVMALNPKLRIKSSSFATSMAPQIPATVSGSQTLSFNLRYASVKSAFLNFGGGSAVGSANGNLDSFDITGGNGDYQYSIAGMNYPQKALSTKNNKAGCLMELRRAMGSIFGKNVAVSINAEEYAGYTTAGPTTVFVPSKFWLGVNLAKLTVDQKMFFTGISTQLSPVQVNINIGTATTYAINPMLILYYDSIIEIDTMTKQVLMVQ
jgi:hypothetical protein